MMKALGVIILAVLGLTVIVGEIWLMVLLLDAFLDGRHADAQMYATILLLLAIWSVQSAVTKIRKAMA